MFPRNPFWYCPLNSSPTPLMSQAAEVTGQCWGSSLPCWLPIDWMEVSTVPSCALGAVPVALLGCPLNVEHGPREDTHTHPPHWTPPQFLSTLSPCYLTPDLIKIFALPLGAQVWLQVFSHLNLEVCGAPLIHFLLLASERSDVHSKLTQSGNDRQMGGC